MAGQWSLHAPVIKCHSPTSINISHLATSLRMSQHPTIVPCCTRLADTNTRKHQHHRAPPTLTPHRTSPTTPAPPHQHQHQHPLRHASSRVPPHILSVPWYHHTCPAFNTPSHTIPPTPPTPHRANLPTHLQAPWGPC